MPKLKFKKIKNSHKIAVLEDWVEQLERRVEELERRETVAFVPTVARPYVPPSADTARPPNPYDVTITCFGSPAGSSVE